MPVLTLATDQVIDLVKQLSPEGKRAVLNVLSAEREVWWEEMVTQGEEQLRQICAERGLDWNLMSEGE